MKIGILSDTHNNLRSLQAALDALEAREIKTLVHCGDLTGVEVAFHLAGWAEQSGCTRLICVFGNGDIATGEMRTVLLAQNPGNYAGMAFSGDVNGVAVAAAHGHVPGTLDELVHSGRHAYVFKGHSHRRSDERVGPTRVINPGALGGLRPEPRSVCLLDLETGKSEFIQINP